MLYVHKNNEENPLDVIVIICKNKYVHVSFNLIQMPKMRLD